jgi:hypothetical protein
LRAQNNEKIRECPINQGTWALAGLPVEGGQPRRLTIREKWIALAPLFLEAFGFRPKSNQLNSIKKQRNYT